jgi:hypothetical protein
VRVLLALRRAGDASQVRDHPGRTQLLTRASPGSRELRAARLTRQNGTGNRAQVLLPPPQKKLLPCNAESPSNPGLHILKEEFKPVAQIPHTRIWVPLQLEALRNDLDRPVHQLRVLARFEAQVEVSSVFGVDAELVD